MPLLRSKAEHVVLAGPFGWQVGEAGNSHPMRELPVDGGRDEIGRRKRARPGDAPRSGGRGSGQRTPWDAASRTQNAPL